MPQSVLLDTCEVTLPPAEFAYLAKRAAAAADFEVPLRGGRARGGAAGGRRLRDAVDYSSGARKGCWGRLPCMPRAGGGGACMCRPRCMGCHACAVRDREPSTPHSLAHYPPPAPAATDRAAAIAVKGAALAPGGASLLLGSLAAGTVSGVNVTLLPAPAGAAPPQPFVWVGPDGLLTNVPASDVPTRFLPVWAAVLVALAACGGVAGTVAVMIALLRRYLKRGGGGALGKHLSRRLNPHDSSSEYHHAAVKALRERDYAVTVAAGPPGPLHGSAGESDADEVSLRAVGVQVAEDRPLHAVEAAEHRPAGPRGGGANGVGAAPPHAGALSAPRPATCHRVHAEISRLQQQILARRLEPRKASSAAASLQGCASSVCDAAAPSFAASAAGDASHGLAAAAAPAEPLPTAGALDADAAADAADAAGAPAPSDADAAGGPTLARSGDSLLGLAAYQEVPPDIPDVYSMLSGGGSPEPSGPLGQPQPGAVAGPLSSVSWQPSCGPSQGLELLEIVGRGSFATVYRGVWRGRYVAVKVGGCSRRGAGLAWVFLSLAACWVAAPACGPRRSRPTSCPPRAAHRVVAR
jgi:hypothetical protein